MPVCHGHWLAWSVLSGATADPVGVDSHLVGDRIKLPLQVIGGLRGTGHHQLGLNGGDFALQALNVLLQLRHGTGLLTKRRNILQLSGDLVCSFLRLEADDQASSQECYLVPTCSAFFVMLGYSSSCFLMLACRAGISSSTSFFRVLSRAESSCIRLRAACQVRTAAANVLTDSGEVFLIRSWSYMGHQHDPNHGQMTETCLPPSRRST